MRLVKQLLIACLVLGILAAPAWAESNPCNRYTCSADDPFDTCDEQDEREETKTYSRPSSHECLDTISGFARTGATVGGANGDPPEPILMIGCRRRL